MQLGKRDWQSLRYVLGRKETYTALLRALTVFDHPLSVLRDELFSSSLSRDRVPVRTPIGRVHVHLSSAVDMSTLMGVFCREDYRIDSSAKVVVDIGANIGIATLYFLTRSRNTRVYAYEPVERNIRTFRENIAPYANRCELVEAAVGNKSGTAAFGVEPTGKFGGLKVKSDTRIQVPCISINELMEVIVSRHDEVDCLKVDVEGTEKEILSSMEPRFWDRIRRIYAENCDATAFMPPRFRRTFRYNVEQLQRKN